MGNPPLLGEDHYRDGPAAAMRQPEQRLLVSEIFGPTIQGEGVSIGLPVIFLRLAGCPLSCSWCDTAYAWDWNRFDKQTETETMTARQAWAEVERLASGTAVGTLVISGGEPASQWRNLAPVVELATQAGWRVEMETSGAVDPGPLTSMLDLVTVSPKLASAGMDTSRRLRLPLLRTLAALSNTVFKFVIADQQDLMDADALIGHLGLRVDRVMLMAEATGGQQSIDNLKWVLPAAISRGYRVTPRLHTLLWGNQRGH